MHMQLQAKRAEERSGWAEELSSRAARFDRERAISESLGVQHTQEAIRRTELEDRLQSMTVAFIILKSANRQRGLYSESSTLCVLIVSLLRVLTNKVRPCSVSN